MELIGNLKGTHWEPGKNEKKSFPPPLKFKRKKSKAFSTWAYTHYKLGVLIYSDRFY